MMDLILRPVVREDAGVLFRWLNAEDRRLASFRTPNPISWSDHVQWLDNALANPDVWHAIAFHDDHAAGQLRAERQKSGVVVSIYVDEAFRRCGVGRIMIDAACKVGRTRWPGLPILAHVRKDNPRSIAFFENNRFSRAAQYGDCVVLQRG